MIKRLMPVLLVTVASTFLLFSCKKAAKSTGDDTMNYFPIKLGKFVTYDVDSTIFLGSSGCLQIESRTQIKYVISDTFRDSKKRLSYIMDVYTRPHEGSTWGQARVILLTPAAIPQLTTTPPPNTPQNSILYSQDGVQYMKIVFPVTEGVSWKGNSLVDLNNPELFYLKNWNYIYQDFAKPFNNGRVVYNNTVTVLENNESVNYPNLDSNLLAYRIYSKEVYGYNIGMVYRERTYWTYTPFTNKCVDGYTVIMRAIDHN